MKTLTAVLLLLAPLPARADVPRLPEPKPQAAPAPTSGGYYYQTCAIATYCLGSDGKWVPEPAADEPKPKPPGRSRSR
jgi:hypothetical protein